MNGGKRSSNIMGRSENIHLIPSFTFDRDKDEYLIKFKTGKDKLLNIKDLSYFIDCYKRSAKYDLSTKVTLDFSKDDIAEDSKALFKYLEDYIEESHSFYNYVNRRYYVAAPPSSYISLEKNRINLLFNLANKDKPYSLCIDKEILGKLIKDLEKYSDIIKQYKEQ